MCRHYIQIVYNDYLSTRFSFFSAPLVKLPSAVLAVLLASTLLSACSDSSQNAHSGRSKRPQSPHLVETVRAAYQNISISRTLTGTLQAIREVKIINQTPGLLIALPVYPGDVVKTRQTLVRLNDSLPRAEVLKAQATLDQTSLDLRRLKDLAPRKLASESEIAQAQTLRDIAAAELQLKQTRYQHTHIRSPMDGIISERLAEPGDALISKDNPLKISIDALGDQQFTGKIKRIFPSIDEDTRRGTLEIILNPVPTNARPGQLCRVRIETQKKSRLMVPYDTVRYDKQGEYVYTFEKNQVKRVNISLGIQQGELIEVLSGLQDQQEIISQGFFGLKDKMKVEKVTPSQEQPTAPDSPPSAAKT